jgi:hypothetical protein
MGRMRNVCKILVGKPEGRRPLGRFRRRWEDNIRRRLVQLASQGLCSMELVSYVINDYKHGTARIFAVIYGGK